MILATNPDERERYFTLIVLLAQGLTAADGGGGWSGTPH